MSGLTFAHENNEECSHGSDNEPVLTVVFLLRSTEFVHNYSFAHRKISRWMVKHRSRQMATPPVQTVRTVDSPFALPVNGDRRISDACQ